MDNQDKSTFSLDDEEIVEEEVIDRDEEYEDDDYDDEDYDDEEYDDEDYDDEEYDDEEYDDEGEDGYNEDYYDDRLNKVLDELAELKRGMVPATQGNGIQQPPPIMPPQYIYQPTAPPAGSEVVMYNEISRLRDELAKNSSSLEMQKELTRIKEDMARDQKFAESQYNAEIKRLQDRIDDLLKNGLGPQGELPYSEQPRLEGGSLNVDKLLSVNEAILRATRDSDAKLQGEIGQLKKQLEEMPSMKELGSAVNAVKKAANNINGGLDPAVLSNLANQLASLTALMEEEGMSASSASSAPVNISMESEIGSSELLRQLYAVRTAIGSASEDAEKRATFVYDLIGEYKNLDLDIHSKEVSYKDKLEAVYNIIEKIKAAPGADLIDLVGAVNALVRELAAEKYTNAVFNDITAFCNQHGMTTITPAIRDGSDRYFRLVQKLNESKTDVYGDILPDLLKEINALQSNKKEAENAALIGEITALLVDEKADKAELTEKAAHFAALTVADVIALPTAEMLLEGQAKSEVTESIFTKLAEIKADIQMLSVLVQERPAAPAPEDGKEAEKAEAEAEKKDEPAEPTPEQLASEMEQAASVDENAVHQMIVAVDELKAKLESYTEVAGMADALEEIRKNYIDITEKIVGISEQLQAKSEPDDSIVHDPFDDPPPQPAAAAETNSALADDMAYIRGKLDEYQQIIGEINDIRVAVMNMDGAAGASAANQDQVTDQTNTIIAEITGQFDKLYDDLSNVLLESETNIINHLDQSGSGELSVNLENAKADILAETQAIKEAVYGVSDNMPALADNIEVVHQDILADTQAIKDSLAAISDSILVSPVADAVEVLRADVGAFIDQYTVNADAAAADRQRLIDDVAFLREQAELAISEADQIPEGAEAVQDTEKFIGYLDDIAARVTLLTNIADDTATTRAAVTSMGDNVTLVVDNINIVNDNVTALGDNIATVNENISSVNGNITAIGDNIAVVNDNVTAVSDNVAAMADGIASVTEGMTTVNDTVASVNETIAAVSGNITAIGDNIAVVNDNITAVADNVNAMADGIASVTEGMASVNDTIAAVNGSVATITEDVSGARSAAEGARDAASATLDALAPIADQLNMILDKLDAPAESAEGYDEEESAPVTGLMADEELIELKDSLNTILDTLPLFPQADDVVTARDNTYAILDSLALLPQAEDVVTTRDNVATILDAVNTLSENISAILSAQQSGGNNDGLVQNIERVLDRIEQFSADAANNKQEIIDAVSGIREEIHINTLDENMSAAGMDGETRDALLGEIAEIRERLVNIETATQSQGENSSVTLDGISAQLAELQAALADGMTAAEGETVAEGGDAALENENMQVLIEQLAAIREKLDAAPEYDTVEEILSLRDDIKAARIVDQDDVSGELEAIKNELAAISSGNILDEIRALREDIINLPGEGATEPTDSEINLVLNEIVSLRDEVFAFKDEVLAASNAAEPTENEEAQSYAEPTDNGDDVTTILDEISALRADQSAINENLDELKDIISRRTSVNSDETGAQNVSGDLNVVLDEIINLKNDVDRIQQNLGADKLEELASQVEEMRAALSQLAETGVTAQEQEQGSAEAEASQIDLTVIMEQFDNINAALDDLRNERDAFGTEEGGAVPAADYSAEIAELRAEIEQLRSENAQLRAESDEALSAQLSDLKESIRDMMLSMTPPTTTESGDTSYAALIEELREIKAQVAAKESAPQAASLDEETIAAIREALAERTDTVLAVELGDIRDEIAQLRSLTTVAAESSGSVELAAIRDEIAELKSIISSPDSLRGVAEDVTAIMSDVRTLKEEPDLGVMSEILALREEFQSLREQIEDVKRIAGRTDKESDETIMNEVQSLRDQLFAISMANVNDPASGESNYESYNNIILDELASLREQVEAAGTASDLAAITEEFNKLQAAIDRREAAFEAIVERVSKLNNNDAANNKILGELAALRSEMESQRDADLTTLNFMSEMARLLERQNQYLTQNTGERIHDEIESLKAEIASSDAVAEEVAKLRELMTQTGNASDNETILNELADLREELSREKPSRENALILDAISLLRDEITTLAEREAARDSESDAGLNGSLSDLRAQLNEIAGIVEPAPSVTEKPASAKRGKKSGKKSGTGKKAASAKNPTTSTSTSAKRGRKPGQKNAAKPTAAKPAEEKPEPYAASDFDALIDEQAQNLVGEGDMALNVNETGNDAMYMAEKIAKQVANKLIMEQLVEQLGDGGVSDDRVEEILRDILPQEFTTIAETEASDKVRRLANQLVLNKLRARLNGKIDDED